MKPETWDALLGACVAHEENEAARLLKAAAEHEAIMLSRNGCDALADVWYSRAVEAQQLADALPVYVEV